MVAVLKMGGENEDDLGVDNGFEPVCPLYIEFEDVEYEIEVERRSFLRDKLQRRSEKGSEKIGKKLMNLKGVKGSIRPGDFVALMGPSGAGKSTFLNLLSGQIQPTKGRISISPKSFKNRSVVNLESGEEKDVLHKRTVELRANKERTEFYMRNNTSFMHQEDIFFGRLTVHEHLSYQAELRLDRRNQMRKSKVDNTIICMNLTKSRNSYIGNVGDSNNAGNISGGEKKRLSCGTELLNSPSIIFADEPTTGLDSHMAMEVLNLFSSLCEHRRTVICTIHQPSSKLFEMFTKIILLCDGRFLFFGSVRTALSWYAQRYSLACSPLQNPADFLVNIASFEGLYGEERLQRVAEYADDWLSQFEGFVESADVVRDTSVKYEALLGQLSAENMNQNNAAQVGGDKIPKKRRFRAIRSPVSLTHLSSSPVEEKVPEEAGLVEKQKKSFFSQTLVHFRRNARCQMRNPQLTTIRLVQTLLMALIPSTIFFNLPYSMKGYMNRISGSFFVFLCQGLMAVLSVVMTFPENQTAFSREKAGGISDPRAYFLGVSFSELWIQFVYPVIFHSICYYMMNLGQTFTTFLYTGLILILASQTIMGFGYVISVLTNSSEMGLLVAQMFNVVSALLSGFMVKIDSIPKIFLPFVYMLPFYYGLSAYTIVLLDNVQIDSKTSGHQFLETFLGVKADMLHIHLIMLTVLLFVVRAVAMLAIHAKYKFFPPKI